MKVHTGALLMAATWTVAIGGVTSKAEAKCADPHYVCFAIQSCLYDTNPNRENDRRRIMEGADSGNGHLVWQGLEACQKDMGRFEVWRPSSAGCTDGEYAAKARAIKEQRPQDCTP
jgi:hypothetical protein